MLTDNLFGGFIFSPVIKPFSFVLIVSFVYDSYFDIIQDPTKA